MVFSFIDIVFINTTTNDKDGWLGVVGIHICMKIKTHIKYVVTLPYGPIGAVKVAKLEGNHH